MPSQIEVLLFAAAAQITGQRSVTVELESPATLAELAQSLARQYPGLGPLIPISRWAIDQQFAPLDALITSHQEIALIPPVSGG